MAEQSSVRRVARALLVVSFGIFVAEFLIMWGLGRAQWLSPPLAAVLDSVIVTAVTFPLLYLLLGRPAERYRVRLEREIQERKRAQEELAQHRNQLEVLVEDRTAELEAERNKLGALLEHMPEGVVFVDEGRHVLLANRVARSYAALWEGGQGPNRRLTHLAGRPTDEFLAPEALATRSEIVVEEPEPTVFEVVADRLGTGKGSEGSVLLIRDVTRERQVERQLRQQERLAAVGGLAAGIAHDFNNILQGVLIHAELVLNQPSLPSSLGDKVKTIIHEAERGASLIRQILDFTRKSGVMKHAVDLVASLRNSVRLLRRTIPEHIQIQLEEDPAELWVLIDHAQLQQTITNLALNARDAMPDGGEFRVKSSRFVLQLGAPPALPGMAPGSYGRITVEDTGTGISESIRPYIFEPFFTTKPPGSGTGLGLAQVYGIVKQHGGYINSAPREGGGTRFEIYLPEIPPGEKVDPGPERPSLARVQGRTILVAEDDASTLKGVRQSLTAMGYKVLTAVDGAEALRIHAEHFEEIVLVLTDAVMPALGGLELIRRLREEHAELPAILITGYPLSVSEQEALQGEVAAWLQKPISIHRLASKVEAVLGPAT